MPVEVRRIAQQHGMPEPGLSRYFALYFAQVGWLVLGAYLIMHALWPSTCMPTTFMRAVKCSIHLPDNRGWIESALMTWLWTTPMLVALELSRRLGSRKR